MSGIGLRTLVLNANYMPISLFPLHTIPVEDAVTRVFNKTCSVAYSYDRKILSPSLDMNWPSIIIRKDYLKPKEMVKLRPEALFYRDEGTCAYCAKELTISDLTYDHVIPRKHGGKSSWTNIVSSCSKCNSEKGDSMPKGIWAPRVKPFKPTYFQLLATRKKYPINVDHSSWIEFLGKWEGKINVKYA
jgi:5-methylcytosine-specific restriction endonuclease McrA